MNYEEIYDIFEDCGNIVCIADLELIYKGDSINYLVRCANSFSFWTGNPETDDYAEELVMTDDEFNAYANIVINEF
jgi:hypothetical protein